MGATRRQIVTEALTESILLAIGGGIAGLLVAVAAAKLLLALAFHSSQSLPISTTPSVIVLAFALGVSLLTGMIFGAAPAGCHRTDPAEALRGSGQRQRSLFHRPQRAAIVRPPCLSSCRQATMMRAAWINSGCGFGSRSKASWWICPSGLPGRLAALYRELRTGSISCLECRVGLASQSAFTDNWAELVMVAGHPAPS
jgi:hypothetical protein